MQGPKGDKGELGPPSYIIQLAYAWRDLTDEFPGERKSKYSQEQSKDSVYPPSPDSERSLQCHLLVG
ncbi:hypothetical protein AVEN_7256-1, partial [Araneus ventricosus]